jgi:16S rRNA (uracil1498-N3)-methyltransferase
MASKPQRLFVEDRLEAMAEIELDQAQAHYLITVLRCKAGDEVLLFNGIDGEWRGELAELSRKKVQVLLVEQTRRQEIGPDLHYLFAPLKRARLDYMAQKATEMGASVLRPVVTRRTVAERVNVERLRANAIEAAEQCGILRIPEVLAPQPLDEVIRDWDPARLLVYADEGAELQSPIATLSAEEQSRLAVLIGPEGGFDEEERTLLRRQPFVRAVSLGPRLLRADTAAVAALSIVNAVLGDWR